MTIRFSVVINLVHTTKNEEVLLSGRYVRRYVIMAYYHLSISWMCLLTPPGVALGGH